VNASREEVLEFIEVSLVELKGIALPRDLAELRELAMDVRDAEDLTQLKAIHEQAKNLRDFCERRARSTSAFPSVSSLPVGRRRM
jgi:hypothetical protein